MTTRPGQAVWVCARPRTYAQPKRFGEGGSSFSPEDFEHAATVASYSQLEAEPVGSAAAYDCGAFSNGSKAAPAKPAQPDASSLAAAVAPRGSKGHDGYSGRVQTASRAAKWRQPAGSTTVLEPASRSSGRGGDRNVRHGESQLSEACRPLSPEKGRASIGVQTLEVVSCAVQTDDEPPPSVRELGRTIGKRGGGGLPPRAASAPRGGGRAASAPRGGGRPTVGHTTVHTKASSSHAFQSVALGGNCQVHRSSEGAAANELLHELHVLQERCVKKDGERSELLQELSRTDKEWRELVALLVSQLDEAKGRIVDLETLVRQQQREPVGSTQRIEQHSASQPPPSQPSPRQPPPYQPPPPAAAPQARQPASQQAPPNQPPTQSGRASHHPSPSAPPPMYGVSILKRGSAPPTPRQAEGATVQRPASVPASERSKRAAAAAPPRSHIPSPRPVSSRAPPQPGRAPPQQPGRAPPQPGRAPPQSGRAPSNPRSLEASLARSAACAAATSSSRAPSVTATPTSSTYAAPPPPPAAPPPPATSVTHEYRALSPAAPRYAPPPSFLDPRHGVTGRAASAPPAWSDSPLFPRDAPTEAYGAEGHAYPSAFMPQQTLTRSPPGYSDCASLQMAIDESVHALEVQPRRVRSTQELFGEGTFDGR